MTAYPIQADIHACAIMEHVCWMELSARGSLLGEGGTGVGPLGAADLNNQLWDFGTLLLSTDDDVVLRVLDEGFTPFKDNDVAAAVWRTRRVRSNAEKVGGGKMEHSRYKLRGDTLRAFGRGGDWSGYQPFLLKCLRLFGQGIHESLTRTCADQLNALEGSCSPNHAEKWVRDLSESLLCHNDLCESPFAFVKRLLRQYPNLRTWKAGNKACAKMNGFFDLPDPERSSQYKKVKTGKEAQLGPAWTLPAPTMLAIQAWGKASGEHMAAWDKEDMAAAFTHEAQRALEAQKEREAAVVAKKTRTNKAAEVVLAETRAQLTDHLTALPSGGAKEDYLKEQHRGHMARAAVRSHKFPFKTKMGADDKGVAASVLHLTALVSLMVDAAPEVLDLAPEENCEGFRRKLPSASPGLRSIFVDQVEAEDVAEAAELMLQDDPELAVLRNKYVHKKFSVVSWTGTGKGGKKKKKVLESYEIMDVLWDEDHAEEGESEGMWVAACVELGEDGETPAGSKTPLGVVMQKCIVYYDFSEMDADIGRFESS
jgi:hypothetical protein